MGTIGHMQRKKVNRNCQLLESWVWPLQVETFLRPLIRGFSVNICCGLSPLGDIKVDLEPAQPDIIKADMNYLPFRDNSFDTVISDPPWNLSFFTRMRPFAECVRVCRPGGRIIYNCIWFPVSRHIELDRVILRTDNNFANISNIYVFRKN